METYGVLTFHPHPKRYSTLIEPEKEGIKFTVKHYFGMAGRVGWTDPRAGD